MPQDKNHSFSRRRFLKTTGAAAVAASGPAVIIPGRAQPKTLIILQPRPILAGFAKWVKEAHEAWGKRHDVRVVVDFRPLNEIHDFAATEAAVQQGHDLVIIPSSPSLYEDQTIDHREIHEECTHRYGKAHELTLKQSYNPKTKKFTMIASGFYPQPINYRKDLWDAVGVRPDTWEDIRRGGRRIKFFNNHPVAFSLGNDIDGNQSMRAILYAFGASVQNADGQPSLKSQQALEAIKFFKVLFEETMTEEMLRWDNISNNRYMLAGEGSLTLNTASIIRSGENKGLAVTDNIWLARPPRGPAGRMAPFASMNYHFIWKFAKNIETAKQFLVDQVVGNYRERFIMARFMELPCFPGTVPDLAELLANDAESKPPDKFKVLADAEQWTTNFGYPGYANPAIDEIHRAGIIPTTFASAATGKMTPEEALAQADQEVRKIYDKWRALGKV